jgi:3-oxoacyl-[acyl-carrier protein] reductase
MNVQNKVAIVTGGGTGVGRATSLQLAAQGCAVLVNYSRSADEAQATVEEIKDNGGEAIAHCADVSENSLVLEMIEATTREFGKLDILVNNAGTTEFISFKDLDAVTPETWNRIMKVNVIGAFQVARAAAKAIRKTSGTGDIVNVTSVAGLNATGSSIPYAASKAALNNVTLSLARTLAPDIRVNAVAPGFITGRWLENGLGDKYEAFRDNFNENLPLKRVCDPKDVADAILSLLTGSRLVTGHILPCEAGMLLMQPLSIRSGNPNGE